jgi:hypothetical protein
MDIEGPSDVSESGEDVTEDNDTSERSSRPASLDSETDSKPSLDLPPRLQSDRSPSFSSSAESVHRLRPPGPIGPLLLAISHLDKITYVSVRSF